MSPTHALSCSTAPACPEEVSTPLIESTMSPTKMTEVATPSGATAVTSGEPLSPTSAIPILVSVVGRWKQAAIESEGVAEPAELVDGPATDKESAEERALLSRVVEAETCTAGRAGSTDIAMGMFIAVSTGIAGTGATAPRIEDCASSSRPSTCAVALTGALSIPPHATQYRLSGLFSCAHAPHVSGAGASGAGGGWIGGVGWAVSGVWWAVGGVLWWAVGGVGCAVGGVGWAVVECSLLLFSFLTDRDQRYVMPAQHPTSSAPATALTPMITAV